MDGGLVEHQSSAFKRFWLGLSDTKRGWLTMGVIAVVIVVPVVVVIYLTTARDRASYEAGRIHGVRYANIHVSIGAGNSESRSGIEWACMTAANTAVSSGSYWDGGTLEGEDIDFDDYKSGCVDAASEILS